ncbi:hypothetical protein BH23PLA1_BH23PLA1_33020 [soil metagenome]
MEFARGEWLWLNLLLPLLALLVSLTRRRRVRNWSVLGQPGRPPGDGGWAWLLAMGLLILALGQPRWGRLPGSELPPGHDVVLLIDVSRSMAAEDAVPDRLGAAVESAERLVEALGRGEGNRAAVVAFAGRGVVRCPLTSNLGAVVETLKTLRAGEVRPGGTDLGAAIDTAIAAFDTEERAEGRTIVLFSDGEDHVRAWNARLARLQADGIILHAVALGDPEQGHPLPVPTRRGETKSIRYLTHQGEVVRSKRDDEPLRALSLSSGGAFVPLGLASADLGALYRERIEPIARQRRDAERPPERVERFPLFVLAALFFGLVGSWPRWRRKRVPWRRPRLLPLLLLGGLILGASDRTRTPAEAVAEGNAAYERGDPNAALAAFEQAIRLAPRDPVPRYNAGATLFQLGRFGEAIERYRQARPLADAGLRTKIDFAIGNTSVALGDIASALRHYDACLESTVAGPDYDVIRQDAWINRQFAEQLAASGLEDSPGDPGGEGAGDDSDDPSRPGPPEDDPEADPEAEADRVPDRLRSSPVGGAGGSGTREPPPGTPEARLADAIETIQDARQRRLPPAPPSTEGGNRKEW